MFHEHLATRFCLIISEVTRQITESKNLKTLSLIPRMLVDNKRRKLTADKLS